MRGQHSPLQGRGSALEGSWGPCPTLAVWASLKSSNNLCFKSEAVSNWVRRWVWLRTWVGPLMSSSNNTPIHQQTTIPLLSEKLGAKALYPKPCKESKGRSHLILVVTVLTHLHSLGVDCESLCAKTHSMASKGGSQTGLAKLSRCVKPTKCNSTSADSRSFQFGSVAPPLSTSVLTYSLVKDPSSSSKFHRRIHNLEALSCVASICPASIMTNIYRSYLFPFRVVGNDHFCDTTERASQRLFCSYKGGFPCITEVGRNPSIPQPCSPLKREKQTSHDSEQHSDVPNEFGGGLKPKLR